MEGPSFTLRQKLPIAAPMRINALQLTQTTGKQVVPIANSFSSNDYPVSNNMSGMLSPYFSMSRPPMRKHFSDVMRGIKNKITY